MIIEQAALFEMRGFFIKRMIIVLMVSLFNGLIVTGRKPNN